MRYWLGRLMDRKVIEFVQHATVLAPRRNLEARKGCTATISRLKKPGFWIDALLVLFDEIENGLVECLWLLSVDGVAAFDADDL